MIVGKHGAVIGWKNSLPENAGRAHTKSRAFQPITAPTFPMIINSRNFAKRQCKLQWWTPPIYTHNTS